MQIQGEYGVDHSVSIITCSDSGVLAFSDPPCSPVGVYAVFAAFAASHARCSFLLGLLGDGLSDACSRAYFPPHDPMSEFSLDCSVVPGGILD